MKPLSDFGQYEFEPISNYDGDSMWTWLVRTWDFGFGDFITKRKKVNVRLLGADTPELKDKRPDWKAAAVLARDLVNEWLKSSTVFLSLQKPDKYGRALGDFVLGNDERFSRRLITKHLAVPYEGQNKVTVEALHAANIETLKSEGRI